MSEQLFKMVDGERVQLTEEETAARQAEESAWAVQQGQQAQLRSAYDAAEAAFKALPKGKQSLWKAMREDVGTAILAGDFTLAREILETTPPTIYEGAATDRDIFLALLP